MKRFVVALLLYHSPILHFTHGILVFITIDLPPFMKKLDAGNDK